ncbi:MAG: SCP2 sterol-binding domain-containing protein [Candidatus Levybacteria bacterium]|nr:SCP2 sterol-binding domain-containing protein [Candidatus Levybacteria bacterium]
MSSKQKELANEIAIVTSRVADLIRPHTDTSLPIKQSTWTIGTAIAHLIISQKVTRKILQGEKNPYADAKPETVAAMNEKLLSEFIERDGKKLATMLVIETDALLKEANRLNDDFTVQTHFGSMDMQTCFAHNLFHLLLHGSIVGQTLNKPLPIDQKHMVMVLPFLKQAMLVTYDAEAAGDFVGTYTIHLKDNEEFSIVCNQETITVEDGTASTVDCHIYADPIVYFLLTIGAVNPLQPILQGKLRVGGPKPWLALRLTKLFRSP